MDGLNAATTFGDLIDAGILLVSDGYRAKNEELGGSGPIFLRAGHVTDTYINFEGVERFRENMASRLAKKMSHVGDVVVTTKGNSTGRVTYVGSELPTFVYSPHLSFWRSLQPNVLVPEFLRYWSRGREFREQLAGLAGSTDMAPYLSLVDQRRLRITLPQPSEQQAIGNILGVLDDKIELNRRMNHTLEAMAAALFKAWFVDFEPVCTKADGQVPTGISSNIAGLFPSSFEDSALGDIPVGWQLATIAEVAEINGSTLGARDPLDRIEYIEISEVTRGDVKDIQIYERGAEPGRARRRLRHGDTALSTVRPDRGSYFLALDPSPYLVASTGFAVLTPQKVPWSFLHAALTRSELFTYLGRLADGAAYPAVSPDVIGAWQVPLPNDASVLDAFHSLCAPLYERAATNRLESRTLASLRDTLLPKLLSSEIRVSEDEEVVATAV
jgi:type I restriction enzyme S subunit